MKYPKLKKEQLVKNIYMAFIQLKDVGAKDIKDTLTVYMNNNLEIWVDIDENDKPCGVSINYHKEDK